ncbi:hypothetical protein PDE_05307 [Penicillium oxalicum 114-2]|uniref:Secreted protein n=1 Tax=Penicillium oxalicum (strain 114-2 / CGMCC 5302) TaxID=933388 RepID=S7ZNZ5_PENO1|nr:hypothetical protein PDE_05307 [Penicillium oxalicum 114-2]
MLSSVFFLLFFIVRSGHRKGIGSTISMRLLSIESLPVLSSVQRPNPEPEPEEAKTGSSPERPDGDTGTRHKSKLSIS